VARAKRTDRADARRRYRQVQLGEVDGAEPADAPPVPTRGSRPAPATAERPSITAAFRNAYHRANIREDIAALPWLLRGRGFLIALGLVLAGGAVMALFPRGEYSLLYFTFVVFDPRSGSPGFLPIMLVGFLAPRASYLLGLIIGAVDFAIGAWFAYAILPLLVSDPADASALQQAIPSTIPIALVYGTFFAAAAAWYRRFLQLSNARTQQRRRQAGARPGRPAKT